jgi:hypothetical protein
MNKQELTPPASGWSSNTHRYYASIAAKRIAWWNRNQAQPESVPATGGISQGGPAGQVTPPC